MASHDSFWVVAGTAAPVIALAVVVSLGDTLRVFSASPFMSLPAGPGVIPEENTKLHFKASVTFLVLAFVGLSNICLQAGLLAVSLISLDNNASLVPAWLAIAAAVGGLLLLTVSAVGAVYLRTLSRTMEQLNEQHRKRLKSSS